MDPAGRKNARRHLMRTNDVGAKFQTRQSVVCVVRIVTLGVVELDFSRSFMGIGDREPTITWSVDCSHGFASVGAAFSRVGLRSLSWNASRSALFSHCYT